MRFFLTLVSLLVVSTSSHAGTIGGPVINPSNNHAYYLLGPSSWHSAESEAIAIGGHLVAINDDTENDWVYATFSSFNGTQRNLWMGLTDAAIEGTFAWTNGEPLAFQNWVGIEPNNLNDEDYGSFYTFLYGNGWNDVKSNGEGTNGPYSGVAEIVPEPPMSILIFVVCVMMAFRDARPSSSRSRSA